MKKSVVGFVGIAAALFAVAGCTPEARQDVGEAGAKVGDAADKSAKGTAEAVDKTAAKAGAAVDTAAAKTGDAVKGAAVATKDAAKDAAQGTEKAVAKTGAAVADAGKDVAQGTEKAVAKTGAAVAKTGAAVADATKDAAQNTEKAVAKTGAAVAKAGDTLKLTPKVKNAILVDDAASKIDLLDVDTDSTAKTVTLNGTAASADVKKKALADAKKALADHADYKVVDNLKVGAAK